MSVHRVLPNGLEVNGPASYREGEFDPYNPKSEALQRCEDLLNGFIQRCFRLDEPPALELTSRSEDIISVSLTLKGKPFTAHDGTEVTVPEMAERIRAGLASIDANLNPSVGITGKAVFNSPSQEKVSLLTVSNQGDHGLQKMIRALESLERRSKAFGAQSV